MTENQAGITALITAYARAYHATHDDPRIFDDFLADRLFSAEEHALFNRQMAASLAYKDPQAAAANPDEATALAKVMQLQNGPITLSRSRYTEDCLDEALTQGVKQYVILGAGMDTFAFRRGELAGRLEVFEVDHPATQALKQQRVAQAGWRQPLNLHYVPLDFANGSLAAALKDAGYHRSQLSFFSWQGVTYYLSRDAIMATLKDIAGLAARDSTLVFDYMDRSAFDPLKASRRMQLLHSAVQQAGEPMKSGFEPQELGEELGRLGFKLVENLDPITIEQRYFQNRKDDYHAYEHVHFAMAAVVTP